MKLDKYMYKIRPMRVEMLTEGPTDREASILQDHVAYLQQLAGESVVLLAEQKTPVNHPVQPQKYVPALPVQLRFHRLDQ